MPASSAIVLILAWSKPSRANSFAAIWIIWRRVASRICSSTIFGTRPLLTPQQRPSLLPLPALYWPRSHLSPQRVPQIPRYCQISVEPHPGRRVGQTAIATFLALHSLLEQTAWNALADIGPRASPGDSRT